MQSALSQLNITPKGYEQIKRNIIRLKDASTNTFKEIISQAERLDLNHEKIRNFEVQMCYDEALFREVDLKYEKGSPEGTLFLFAIYDFFVRYGNNPIFTNNPKIV